MRLIRRGKEPKSLTTYKGTPGASYGGWTDRKDTKNQLLVEQGFLCAYCTKRICFDDMKIEHITAQSDKAGEEKRLTYSNFLAVCTGGPGSKRMENLSCDSCRGNDELKVNPLDRNTLQQIFYKKNGEIHSKDADIEKDLTKTLNLNCDKHPHYFCENRRRVKKKALQSLKKKGDWSDSSLRKVKSLLLQKNDRGELPPFTDFALYEIEKRLKR